MIGLALLVVVASRVSAQTTCSNYGIPLANSTCDCPQGFSPSSGCIAPTCDNPLVQPASRQVFSSVLSGNASAGCGRQCTDGFVGPTCGVCTTDSACQAAQAAVTGGSSSSTDMSLTNGLGQPVCIRGPWTWTEGFGSCQVVNPTLQSVFAGSTVLTFSKTVEPNESLSVPFGANGTMTAQLWYAPPSGNTTLVEQFYCAASSCIQSNTTLSSALGAVDYTCRDLRCTCIPGTEFCGAPGSQLDLTSTIDGLGDTLSITCDAATGVHCSFKQTVLQTLFGTEGLALSGCQWGECVLPGTVDRLASTLSGSTTSSSGGGSLSGGVIAGLAVLGAVVAGLLGLLALGCVCRRRARRRVEATEAALLAAGVVSSSSSAETKDVCLQQQPLQGVGISFTNLSYHLRPSPRLRAVFHSSTLSSDACAERLILSSLTASIAGGSFCSVLGPSGSGKTSLVDLLAGVRKTGYRTGTIELVYTEGAEDVRTRERERVRIGYVDQNDVLSETSTVREAVMFAAELKLGEIAHEKKRHRTFEVLSQLGLVDIADTVIGSPEGSGRRGISGGERRRVSIALELVAQPAVLILDEPTSGLDSASALRIVHALKALTTPAPHRRPTTVIVTIHQPSSQLWHLFDDTLVLAQGGTQLYFGKARDVYEWWEARGQRCPEGWNPADFLLDLATSPPANFLPLRPDLTPRQPLLGHLVSSSADAHAPLLYRRGLSAVPAMLRKNANAHRDADRRPRTTALTQVEVLAKRQAKELVRDKGLLLMHNLILPLVALFVGGMYYKVDLSIGGFQSRIGALFFSGCLVAFASLSALSNFARAKRLFIRERGRGYHHPLAWLATQVVFDVVPLRLVPTILLGVIVYWMVGLAATAANFFKFLLILVLFALCMTVWNFLLATLIDDTGSAILVSSIVVLFEMAYAGFFVNLSSIPPVLRWLQWLAPLKYALEALSVNEVNAGLMIVDELAGAKVQISAEIIMDTLFGFKPDAYYRDVLVLFGFTAGFALLLVLFVLLRLRELR